MSRSGKQRSWGVASVALLAILMILVGGLAAAEWDPTVFVGFGEDATATSEFAAARLGDVTYRPAQGHDGKYFFVQAHDPLLIDPIGHASILDLPIYRSQRMFYPLVGGGVGLLDSQAIVWGLLLVNVVAMVMGTYYTARLAVRLGKSPWWGLAFTGNVGLIYALTSDGSDVLAAAAAAWAVLALYENRFVAVVAGLTIATLSKEVMLVTVVGTCIYLWLSGRRSDAALVGAVPVVAVVLWAGYLRMRLEPDEVGANAIGLPFVGLFQAIPEWLSDPVVLVAGLGVVVLLSLYSARWWQVQTPLAWVYVGFVPLAVVMTEKVWREVFDFTRALAPALTAAVLVVYVEARRLPPDHVRAGKVGGDV